MPVNDATQTARSVTRLGLHSYCLKLRDESEQGANTHRIFRGHYKSKETGHQTRSFMCCVQLGSGWWGKLELH